MFVQKIHSYIVVITNQKHMRLLPNGKKLAAMDNLRI